LAPKPDGGLEQSPLSSQAARKKMQKEVLNGMRKNFEVAMASGGQTGIHLYANEQDGILVDVQAVTNQHASKLIKRDGKRTLLTRLS
jgi:hypothetical protein